MYNKYWGLIKKPFENTPDPEFLYLSNKHEEALMRMFYAINERKGAAMLTGEYGGGKTLLGRTIASRLINQDKMYNVALIVNPAVPTNELLSEIIYQLGAEPPEEATKTDLLHKLNDILYETVRQHRHCVIIVDEAQAIKDEDVFEELRLLLNFQLDDRFLLTLLLFGQPELRIKVNGIKQLHQRLSIIYHLTSLTQKETIGYISHRIKVAGGKSDLFSEDAYRLIYERSKGIPREINNICDLALVVAFGEKRDIVDESVIDNVSKDFLIEEADGANVG
jgi:type II secretory pathway predicted ATPase ExeA